MITKRECVKCRYLLKTPKILPNLSYSVTYECDHGKAPKAPFRSIAVVDLNRFPKWCPLEKVLK